MEEHVLSPRLEEVTPKLEEVTPKLASVTIAEKASAEHELQSQVVPLTADVEVEKKAEEKFVAKVENDGEIAIVPDEVTEKTPQKVENDISKETEEKPTDIAKNESLKVETKVDEVDKLPETVLEEQVHREEVGLDEEKDDKVN